MKTTVNSLALLTIKITIKLRLSNVQRKKHAIFY